MDDKIKDKIYKVHELVKRGGTEGERAAAELALNKLIKKHNLTDEYIKTIHLKKYEFKYATNLDLKLFSQLYEYFFEGKELNATRSAWYGKNICANFEYLDWVMFSCAYEYFKHHMNAEFKKHCVPLINRCKTTKTKKIRRTRLQELFFSQYIIKSKIYNQKQICTVDYSKISEKERIDRDRLEKIQGGSYVSQIITGLYLE